MLNGGSTNPAQIGSAVRLIGSLHLNPRPAHAGHTVAEMIVRYLDTSDRAASL